MSVGYRAIQWNRQKKWYDAALLAALVLPALTWTLVSLVTHPEITAETVILRVSALEAFVLLHVILCIGPLARLDPRFLPLLYNRRHLGVTLFLLAALHATLSTFQFHALGNVNPLVSLFTSYRRDYLPWVGGGPNLAHFPFEPLGALALAILFLMAATSHDFWLAQLGSSFWKTLHLGVFVAYGAVVAHVAYGVLQAETSPVFPVVIALGAATVLGLHVAAARRETRADRSPGDSPTEEGFVRACRLDELVEGRGRTVVVEGRRLAVFRAEGKIYALSNVCRHQGGPIGEGRVVDGCITCPWHGWQYRPEDGCSPPPFEERVETYRVRLRDREVWIDPASGTLGEPRSGEDADHG